MEMLVSSDGDKGLDDTTCGLVTFLVDGTDDVFINVSCVGPVCDVDWDWPSGGYVCTETGARSCTETGARSCIETGARSCTETGA